MSNSIASAPGKVVLGGEYAVLNGAPAIAMAVNRRAIVRASRAAGETAAADKALLECVCRTLGADIPQGAVEQLTDSFYNHDARGRRVKLGIGSSAALAVALCRYLAEPGVEDSDLMKTALKAHRAFQGGAGSGVDVATSLKGGLICYSIGDAMPRSLHWPDGLRYGLLWSGRPADTRQKISRFLGREPSGSATELEAASAVLAESWIGGNVARLMRDYHDYTGTLQRFDADHELGIFGAGHDALTTRASRLGLVYKPCGAGGGDIGIALSPDELLLNRFVDEARGTGFAPLDLSLDDRGAALGTVTT